MRLKEIVNSLNQRNDWKNSYTYYVPKFIDSAKQHLNWEDWDKDVFNEFFEKSKNQCVSSLQQGYFDKKEQQLIKDNWTELSLLLQELANNQETPNFELYEKIAVFIKQYTTQHRQAATNRLIASLQPQLLCTIVANDHLKKLYNKLKPALQSDEFPKYDRKNWFKSSNNILNYFKTELGVHDSFEIMTYPWQIKDSWNYNKMSVTMIETELNEKISLLKNKKQIILQGPPGTGKTRLAKQIASRLLNENGKELLKNEYNQLIQFHPSYTYEDFVRGITVKSREKGLEYITENKILGKIAKAAHQNYLDSKKESSEITIEKWFDEQFELFKGSILDGMDDEGKFKLNDAVNIIDVEEDAFRYTGQNNWSSTRRMKYSDIIKLYNSGVKERQEIQQQTDVNALAISHATYFKLVLDLFYTFMEGKVAPTDFNEKVELKNYVLIIDEINRANLSSVLGELIYAFEYRGEPVESIYEMEEGGNSIILPPNLYIIGTMNTADRSVGQIDYAIRRRFAFVDVLPEALSESTLENNLKFNTTMFNKVAELFKDESTHLSEEFKAKDVQLGHSYFLYEEGKFDLKLEYEIKPILREYVADGILKETALDEIEKL